MRIRWLPLLGLVGLVVAASATDTATTGNFSITTAANPFVISVQDSFSGDVLFQLAACQGGACGDAPITVLSTDLAVQQADGNYIFGATPAGPGCSSWTSISSPTVLPGGGVWPAVQVEVGTSCGWSLQLRMQPQAVRADNLPTLEPSEQHLDMNITAVADGIEPVRRLQSSSSRVDGLGLSLRSQPGELILGGGFQYTHTQLKGHEVPIFSREQGVGRGLQPATAIMDQSAPDAGGDPFTAYSAVPAFYGCREQGAAGTACRGFYVVRSDAYLVLNSTAASDPGVALSAFGSTSLRLRVLPSGDLPALVASYARGHAGVMQPLPAWSDAGAVVGLEDGTQAVQARLERMLEVVPDAPLAGTWLQDWCGIRNITGAGQLPRVGLWWNWVLDGTLYDDFSGFVQRWADRGVRTTIYVNVLVANVSGKATPTRRDLLAEALAHGYAVKVPVAGDNEPTPWFGYGESVMVDFTNFEARRWITQVIQTEMLALNVSGWMADFGESLPLQAALAGGDCEGNHPVACIEQHNQWPRIWADVNNEAIRAARQGELAWQPDDIVYFMRSASATSPAAAKLFWLGDQLVTWDRFDGLASAVIGGVTAGLTGFSVTHSDIGGYTTLSVPPVLAYKRSKELFLRWSELGAMSAFFRTHLGSQPYANWQVDSDNETTVFFFRQARLFRALQPYRTVGGALPAGLPTWQAMPLCFPGVAAALSGADELATQFCLGSADLLAAPVVQRRATTRRVWLPAGTAWQLVWELGRQPGNATVWQGADGFVDVPAPLGDPPLLVRQGSQLATDLVARMKAEGLFDS